MSWEAWVTVGVVVLIVGLLTFTRVAADLVMAGAVTLLVTLGVLKEKDAFAGFANEGMLTVAVLFVVAAGIRETGAMAFLAQGLLGRPTSTVAAQARMVFPVAGMSAFMNNTPLVAMMLPVVSDWAKKFKISPSHVMMPLSFASILGGLCTLIGTSTNVVIGGLVARQFDKALHMFDPTWIGLPCALVGIGYMLAFGRWLLPDRRPALGDPSDARQYTVEMVVDEASPLVGKTIEQAGLRHLSGLYLAEIDRGGEVMAAVGPEQRLHANDRLVFVGVVESVVELQKIRGLKPATDQVFKLDAPRTVRCLIEAVVSDTCRLVGQTIREGQFRTTYDAVVIALARNGELVRGKLGDVTLRPGDVLLLEAHPAFAARHRNSRDFYLVSQVDESTPPRHDRAWFSLGILAGMVIASATGVLSTLNAALIAAGLMIGTGCCRASVARRNIDWHVLAVIGLSFGVGKAMETTGAAQAIAQAALGWAGSNPWVALAAVYALAMIFTEVMTNNAAAVLVFPIAVATAETLGVNPMPFIMAILVAASCGFATPIGYQTNLMVYGPGGYRFVDYLRFGGTLNLLMMAVTVALVPLVWPFAK